MCIGEKRENNTIDRERGRGLATRYAEGVLLYECVGGRSTGTQWTRFPPPLRMHTWVLTRCVSSASASIVQHWSRGFEHRWGRCVSWLTTFHLEPCDIVWVCRLDLYISSIEMLWFFYWLISQARIYNRTGSPGHPQNRQKISLESNKS